MVKAIITATFLTLASIAILFDASVLKEIVPAFLYNHEVQSLIHFFIFFSMTLITKKIQLLLAFAIGIESFQFFVGYRSFEIIDLAMNFAGCLVAKEFYHFNLKTLFT